MTKERSPSYTPAPALPTDPDLRRRFGEIVAVLAQQQTVAGAARSLNLSRNHFQTILHRTIAAMVEAITPKPAGRPAKPEREVALEAENEKLRAQLEAMQSRSEMIERMMGVVSGIASGRTRLPRSQPRSRSKKTKPEDPDPTPTLLQAVTTMREANVPTAVCATVLGVSPSTVRRYARGPVSRARRRTHPALDAAACQRVRTVVRETHGAVGAASLGRMTGLSRRTCALIKSRELREMEHERKARCGAVTIAAPRIVRGFDAMHVAARDGKAYWLVAADAAVPYRTSIATVPCYEAANVMAALVADFELHGPPLVLRLDRIACQRTPEVYDLLRRYEVLPLHGPPRYPRYYGQLERQNREHRDWLRYLAPTSMAELATAAERMRSALNALWPRPSLDGWTAEQAWRAHDNVCVDRHALRRDVERQVAGLVSAGVEALRAQRLAIESALQERGLLIIQQGGEC